MKSAGGGKWATFTTSLPLSIAKLNEEREREQGQGAHGDRTTGRWKRNRAHNPRKHPETQPPDSGRADARERMADSLNLCLGTLHLSLEVRSRFFAASLSRSVPKSTGGLRDVRQGGDCNTERSLRRLAARDVPLFLGLLVSILATIVDGSASHPLP